MAVHKLLIHISDRDKWGSVFSLINRMMKEIEGNDLEIIRLKSEGFHYIKV